MGTDRAPHLAAMQRIEQRLSETLGFDVDTVGATAVDRAVRHRMRQCGVVEVEAYLERLLQDAEELQRLIEQVVIPETWFLRNAEAFHVFRDVVARDHVAGRAGATLRILSVPCSTGEEPYSVAITLSELGMRRQQVRIDAVDVSEQSLALAVRGAYSANAFRGEGAYIRDRYCDPVGNHRYQLRPDLREWVHFGRGNLALPGFRAPLATYDVIFCRNLLIYFDRVAQGQAFETLQALLAPEGYLFLGPAEVPLAVSHGFRSAGYPMAFCCRKEQHVHPRIRPSRATLTTTAPPTPPSPRAVSSRSGPSSIAPGRVPSIRLTPPRPFASPAAPSARASAVPRIAPAPRVANVVAPNAVPPNADLHIVRALADAGRLTAAAEACEPLLRAQTTSADAYYLFGVIQDAMGDVERAVDCYRKALFLDPNHADASMHLAMLLRQDGDAEAAERLHARRRRIEQREQS